MQPYEPYHHPVPAYVPTYGRPVLTDQRDSGAALIVVAWILTVFTLGYLLPWAIAVSRGRSNQAAVGVLNFFLGWTFIGWVVALVMACQAHQVIGAAPMATVVVAQQVSTSPPPGWYPSPTGSGRQYWDGARWTGHRAP